MSSHSGRNSGVVRSGLALLLAVVVTALAPGGTARAVAVPELEPNDVGLQANPLLPGQYAFGHILLAADYDVWVIPDVRTDQVVCALLSSLADNGDPVLSAYFNHEATDTTMADIYNDDGGPSSNAFDDSFFCGERVGRAGSLFLRADGFGSSMVDPYGLFATLISPDQIVPETEPNDTPETATPITARAMSATGSADPDFYSFHANFGQLLVIMMDSNPGRPDPATPFVHTLTLLAADGTTVLVGPADPTYIDTEANDVIGAFPAPTTGTFFVRVDKAGPDDGDYRLVVLVDGDPAVTGACCFDLSCGIESEHNCNGLFAGGGSSCEGDTDSDGLVDACDNCASVGNQSQEDDDADDSGNACDVCVNDPMKVGAGACGCGVPDVDANANGAFECLPGAELEALIQGVVTEFGRIKQAKTEARAAIQALLPQVESTAATGAPSIALAPADFPLAQEVSKFVQLSNKGLKSKKARKKAIKAGNAIIQAVVS